MKKALIALAILNILGGIFGFMMLLGTNIIYALISLGGGILGSVPYFALVGAMEDIEALREEQWELKGQLHKMTELPNNNAQSDTPLSSSPKETSLRVWECVKCKTVNKAGTSCCSNCGAMYSPWINP